MATMFMKGGLKFATTINGAQSVMTPLGGLIVLLFAGSWDLAMQVEINVLNNY